MKKHLALTGKKRVLIIAATVLLLSCVAPFGLINSYETKATYLTVDNFGNFYTADDYRLSKYNSDGKFQVPYEELRYGKIGMVDVNNPMKVMVYYPDFSTAVILDRFLSPLTTYNFFDLGYQNIAVVASSVDGRLWFYDNIDFKLKKIDEAGKVYRESQPLNVLLEETPTPNFLMEREGKVYLNDPNIGVLVFDAFGSYAKTVPLKGLRKFQVFQDQIVYFDSLKLNAYNLLSFETKSLNLPDSTGVIQAAIVNKRMAVLKKDKVDFYKY